MLTQYSSSSWKGGIDNIWPDIRTKLSSSWRHPTTRVIQLSNQEHLSSHQPRNLDTCSTQTQTYLQINTCDSVELWLVYHKKHNFFWFCFVNLSSSSAWRMGRIALRAAYFSSFNALSSPQQILIRTFVVTHYSHYNIFVIIKKLNCWPTEDNMCCCQADKSQSDHLKTKTQVTGIIILFQLQCFLH